MLPACRNNIQLWKRKPALGFWPGRILAFQDLCLANVVTCNWLAAQVVTLVKPKSWKVRMDLNWGSKQALVLVADFYLCLSILRCNKQSGPYLYIKRSNEMTGEIRKAHIVHVMSDAMRNLDIAHAFIHSIKISKKQQNYMQTFQQKTYTCKQWNMWLHAFCSQNIDIWSRYM